jgi:hypothetical protein
MKIDFQTSGGYAGLNLRWSGDTDALPPEQARPLLDLIEQARIFDPPGDPEAPARPGPPDVLSYRLDVIDGARRASFTVTDVTAPPRLRPLLGHLRTLARPAPRSGSGRTGPN